MKGSIKRQPTSQYRSSGLNSANAVLHAGYSSPTIMTFSEGGYCTLCRPEISEMYWVADPKEFWYQQQVYSAASFLGTIALAFPNFGRT
jgi:hypothetical protein